VLFVVGGLAIERIVPPREKDLSRKSLSRSWRPRSKIRSTLRIGFPRQRWTVIERSRSLIQLVKDSKALSQSGRPVFTDQENAHPACLKIKSRLQQEFAVSGFTEGKASRKHFGALLLGAYRNGKLRYFGL
jgi:hypothetical protein